MQPSLLLGRSNILTSARTNHLSLANDVLLFEVYHWSEDVGASFYPIYEAARVERSDQSRNETDFLI